ncbi:MAG: helix-turn-helix domain-containing protein [Pseudomonadota bacterium]
MPLSREHKAQTRARIIETAARLFREHGYEGVGIKALMSAAGLTNGAFYAHFDSKQDLLEAVLDVPLEFTAQLRKAEDRGASREALHYYLDPEHFELIARDCTLATLLGDAARSDAAGQEQLAAHVEELCATIERQIAAEQPKRSAAARRALALEVLQLCIANISLGRALGNIPLTTELAAAARGAIDRRLDAPDP